MVAGDAAWRGTMAAALSAAGYATVTRISAASDAGADAALVIVAGDPTAIDDALLQSPPDVAVLAVGPDNSAVMVAAIEGGAIGYVLDDVPFDQIVQAVDQSLEGHAVVPSHMLGALLRRVVERRRVERADRERLMSLTERERQVFGLAVRGMSNEELAQRLFMSPATARTHLQRVFKKLDIHSRAEAVAFAVRSGLPTERTSDDPSV